MAQLLDPGRPCFLAFAANALNSWRFLSHPLRVAQLGLAFQPWPYVVTSTEKYPFLSVGRTSLVAPNYSLWALIVEADSPGRHILEMVTTMFVP